MEPEVEKTSLTPEEAEAMLARLSQHFHCPVMPIDRYCDALRTWQQCMIDRAITAGHALYPGFASKDRAEVEVALALCETESTMPREQLGESRWEQIQQWKGFTATRERIGFTFIQIQKSNLLCRLLYDGQPLRTTPCPVHNGTWSGCAWPEDPKDICACSWDANVTGWLPLLGNERPTGEVG